MINVAVFGLGKLGLPLAAALNCQGMHVIGVDTDPAAVEAAKSAVPRFYEPGLKRLLPINATTDWEQAVWMSNVVVVIVGTPSLPDGSFSLEQVLAACEQAGTVIGQDDDYRTVMISSTVMPGSCDGPILETLERASGKRLGDGFGLCCCPEFVALGTVLADFLEPSFVIIGASDERAWRMAKGMYERLCTHRPPFYRTSLVNAELIKIALNCYLTTKISFANQLAGICGLIPGANVDAVMNGISLDPRVNAAYLKGAAPYGGPCLPRDDRAMQMLAGSVGADGSLARAVGEFNERQVRLLAGLAVEELFKIDALGRVGILGLAFKPDTDCTIDSLGMALLTRLAGFNPMGYDPRVSVKQSVPLAQVLVDKSDVVVVTTPDRAWKTLRFREGQTVIDCWRCLDRKAVENAMARYKAVGVGEEDQQKD